MNSKPTLDTGSLKIQKLVPRTKDQIPRPASSTPPAPASSASSESSTDEASAAASASTAPSTSSTDVAKSTAPSINAEVAIKAGRSSSSIAAAPKKEHKSARPERGGQATLIEAIRQGIWEEMERDPTVFVIGEDVGAYGGAFKVTDGLLDEFGNGRVIDTPISEAAIVGAACGAGLMGMKAVAEFQFIDFISAGFDLLTNYAAKCRYRWGANIPAVFRGPCGSGVRSGPFHSLNAEAFFLNTAGLKIVEPATAYDAKGLIKAAIRDPDPVLYFEHKKLYRLPRLREELPADDYIVEIGKARTAREGRDLTIITFGAMVLTALDAAEELEKEGLDVEVIDLRTLAPMDKPAILASVKKTNRVIVLHEASRTGGIGGEIAATIAEEAFEWLDAPVLRVASLDTPVPYSPPLEDYYLPQTKDVLDAARKLAAY
jgi:pyruvate/2-oxoglutarate/acetoin dehydrogenase E1 component